MSEKRTASRAQVLLAFAAVYLIWGSTYLAIRYALNTLPPMLLTGARHLTAGIVLYAVTRFRKEPRPRLKQWPNALLLGGLFLTVGNGGVVLAEQHLPSGIAALLVALVPLWMVLIDWLWHGAARPSPQVMVGLFLGLIGIGVLSGPGSLGGSIDRVGVVILLVATLCWATGSLHSRTSPLPPGLTGVSMEMLAGGVLAFIAATVHGEWADFHPAHVSAASVIGLVYLILFGSLVGFTCYTWLLKNVPPARASTYAYVNPVVAVILGWLILGEALTPRMLIAALLILGAVVLITTARALPARTRPETADAQQDPQRAEG